MHYDSARALVESKIEERPEDSRLHSALGIAYAGLGRKEDAVREGNLAVELLPISKEAYRGAYRAIDLAQIYAMFGETDAAIDRLEHLLSIPGPLSVSLLRLDPIWDPLARSPPLSAAGTERELNLAATPLFSAETRRRWARALLGRKLVRRLGNGVVLSGRIVETEAYLGISDRAAHSFGDRRTQRTESMWLDGGHVYVYFTYGMHWLLNIVAEREGQPTACLIRALEPLDGGRGHATPSRWQDPPTTA